MDRLGEFGKRKDTNGACYKVRSAIKSAMVILGRCLDDRHWSVCISKHGWAPSATTEPLTMEIVLEYDVFCLPSMVRTGPG